MIAYDQKYTDSKGNIISTRIVGPDGTGCAFRLSKFRASRGIPNADPVSCRSDVGKDGYKYTIKQKEKAIVRKSDKLSVAKVLRGSLALFDIVKGDIVDDRTIKARSAVCAECPLLSDTSDKCSGCVSNKLLSYARNIAVKYGRNFFQPTITAKHTTPKKTGPISNFYCSHCGCSALNLVLSKSKHFLDKENEARPDNCWVHNKD